MHIYYMVKILLEIDEEEDRIVNIVKSHYKLADKKQAIRKIIKEFGKKIKIEI